MMDFMNLLPDEILICIFKYLPLESLINCECVCYRWNCLTKECALWKHLPVVYSGKPGTRETSQQIFDVISTHHELIHCLKIQYVYDYLYIVSIIEKCMNLTSLELVMCKIEKRFKNDIKKWPNLKKLSLKNSIVINEDKNFSIDFDYFQDLNYLVLPDFGLYDVNCHTLLKCSNLSHIFIEKIRELSLEFMCTLINSRKDILTSLHIFGSYSVDDHTLFLLSKCPHLEDLAIIRCENLSDNGLYYLKQIFKIKRLQIWNNAQFSEQALLAVLGDPNLKKLESLSLSRIENLSAAIVDMIKDQYNSLKFISLYQCPKIVNIDYEKEFKHKFVDINVLIY